MAEGLPEPNLLNDTAAESVGDAPSALHVNLNSTCDSLSLSAPGWEQSMGKDNPQAPGWMKRVRVRRAPTKRPPCLGRVCALEKTLRGYAEKKTDTTIVPELEATSIRWEKHMTTTTCTPGKLVLE